MANTPTVPPRRTPFIGVMDRLIRAGRNVGMVGEARLDADDLKQLAMEHADGLEDFSDPWFEKPLAVLLDAGVAGDESAFAALAASGCGLRNGSTASLGPAGYGELVPDPEGLLDLPPGFSYRVISIFGDPMDDGGTVPDAADGMGCFDLGNGKLALVRNHELRPGQPAGGDLHRGYGRGPGA